MVQSYNGLVKIDFSQKKLWGNMVFFGLMGLIFIGFGEAWPMKENADENIKIVFLSVGLPLLFMASIHGWALVQKFPAVEIDEHGMTARSLLGIKRSLLWKDFGSSEEHKVYVRGGGGSVITRYYYNKQKTYKVSITPKFLETSQQYLLVYIDYYRKRFGA